MRAKEYLQQLQRLDTLINQRIKELYNLRVMLTNIGSFDYSKDRVQTSSSGDAPFVKTIGKIVELEEEINREIDNFIDEKHKIINQIQSLKNSKYIDILYKHYVEMKHLEIIAVDMNFSYNYIKHLHGCALKDFENKVLNSALYSTP